MSSHITKISIIIFCVMCLVFVFLFVPISVEAQESQKYISISPVPGTEEVDTKNPGEYVGTLLITIITISGIYAVLKLAFGGIQYMLSESISSKEAARSTIRSTLYGILLLLASILILQIINPDITKLKFGTIRDTVKEKAEPKQ